MQLYIIRILNDTADVIVNMDTQMYCLFFFFGKSFPKALVCWDRSLCKLKIEGSSSLLISYWTIKTHFKAFLHREGLALLAA